MIWFQNNKHKKTTLKNFLALTKYVVTKRSFGQMVEFFAKLDLKHVITNCCHCIWSKNILKNDHQISL